MRSFCLHISFDCLIVARKLIKESCQTPKSNNISIPSIKVLYHKRISLALSSMIPLNISVNNKLVSHPSCNFYHCKQKGLLGVHTIIARSITGKVIGVNMQCILTGIKQPLKIKVVAEILKLGMTEVRQPDHLRIRQVVNMEIFCSCHYQRMCLVFRRYVKEDMVEDLPCIEESLKHEKWPNHDSFYESIETGNRHNGHTLDNQKDSKQDSICDIWLCWHGRHCM